MIECQAEEMRKEFILKKGLSLLLSNKLLGDKNE